MTPEMRNLMEQLSAYTVEHGIPPTFAELAKLCHHKSKSTTWRMAMRLYEQGHIHMGRDASPRTISVVSDPDMVYLESNVVVEAFRLIDAMETCNSRQRLESTQVLLDHLRKLSKTAKYGSISRSLLTFSGKTE